MSESPLHLAAGGGHEKLIYFLLRCGLSPSIEDCNGDTPLFWAVRFGHSRILRQFLTYDFKKEFNLNDVIDLNKTNCVGFIIYYLIYKFHKKISFYKNLKSAPFRKKLGI